jgi:hypothetical protein
LAVGGSLTFSTVTVTEAVARPPSCFFDRVGEGVFAEEVGCGRVQHVGAARGDGHGSAELGLSDGHDSSASPPTPRASLPSTRIEFAVESSWTVAVSFRPSGARRSRRSFVTVAVLSKPVGSLVARSRIV